MSRKNSSQISHIVYLLSFKINFCLSQLWIIFFSNKKTLKACIHLGLMLIGVVILSGCLFSRGSQPVKVYFQLNDMQSSACNTKIESKNVCSQEKNTLSGIGKDDSLRLSGTEGCTATCEKFTKSKSISSLIITHLVGELFYASPSLAYSRAPGALQYYYYASWSQPPASRLASLLARRLEKTKMFDSVLYEDSDYRFLFKNDSSLRLEFFLDEMLHDDQTPPGVSRIAAHINLLKKKQNRVRKSTAESSSLQHEENFFSGEETCRTNKYFKVSEPLKMEKAAAAAAAFDRAASILLDQVVAWLVVLEEEGYSALSCR